MGLLSSLKNGAIAEPRRWFTILNADDDHELPEVQVLLGFIDADAFNRLVAISRKNPADARPERRAFCRSSWHGIREIVWETETDSESGVETRKQVERDGISHANLLRFGDYFLRHPEAREALTAQVPDPFIPDAEDRLVLIDRSVVYNRMLDFSMGLDGFVLDQLEREKKDSPSTSATA